MSYSLSVYYTPYLYLVAKFLTPTATAPHTHYYGQSRQAQQAQQALASSIVEINKTKQKPWTEHY